ncbi:B3 domain-containing protein REM16-like [Lycium ferocissimum]|uniref:B3 domain-containing protein REM16-like n=1 Tax=Lycium ferocissimum TaxID=112874 RepID=UPI002815382D|nr:B3 domain-containing protein REM16-like [Lycium ferocissimum]
MATICERCKVVEKQKYWEDFDKHQFFKVMMNDFRRRLRIPVKFVKNLKDSHKLLGHKILTGPSGNSWVVEVKRRDEDDFVFCNDGWETFVKDHCLEDTDLLVFKMNNFTSFDVMIFDSTACEKEDTFFVKKHRNSCKHPDEVTDEHSNEEYGYGDDDTVEEDYIREPIRRKGSESSRGKQNQFHSAQPSKGKKMKQIPVAKQDNRTRKCTPSLSRKMNVEPEEKVPVLSNRRQVPEKEKIRVHQLASRHTSSVPSVLMTMQPTHVNMGQLKLPKAWQQKYMRQKSEAITLRIPLSGRRWEATISCRKEGLVIQSGWEDFVRDNELDEIDTCVFELAQGGKHNLKPVVLDVYIYRVKNEIMLPYSNSTS